MQRGHTIRGAILFLTEDLYFSFNSAQCTLLFHEHELDSLKIFFTLLALLGQVGQMLVDRLYLRVDALVQLGLLTGRSAQVGELVLLACQFPPQVVQFLLEKKLLVAAFFANLLLDASELGTQRKKLDLGLLDRIHERLLAHAELFQFCKLCFRSVFYILDPDKNEITLNALF